MAAREEQAHEVAVPVVGVPGVVVEAARDLLDDRVRGSAPAPGTRVDALAQAAKNIGALLAAKHLYFVPFRQDDCAGKPTSLVADMKLLPEAALAALEDRQLQPLLREPVL